MSLDSVWLFAFLACFVRCTSMLMSSPIFGSVVPISIRIMVGMVLSLALAPVVRPYIEMPREIIGLALFIGREAAAGLIIGSCVQLLLLSIQMAGSILDLQLGISSAQLFNPMIGGLATPLAQYKYMLGLVLVLLLNGHHMMLQAFVASYHMAPGFSSLPGMMASLLGLVGHLMLVALQISAPVAGVCLLIDFAASLINKAVPQTQPFLISLPAKVSLGLFALSLGLPGLVVAVQKGLDFTFSALPHIWSGI